MLYLKRPENERIRHWLDEQAQANLSYQEVGMTDAVSLPQGYYHIDHQVIIGQGRSVYKAAKEALSQWGCFHLPWMRLLFDGNPEAGNHLAIAAQVAGFWTVHCTRVIDCCQDSSDQHHWSFTVGTLPRHMLSGEEKISIALDPVSGDVQYRIRSFSRPNQTLSRICVGLIRHHQARFCNESAAAIKRYVRARGRLPMTESMNAS